MKTNLLLLFSAIIAVSCQSNSMDNMVYVKGGVVSLRNSFHRCRP